MFQYRSSPCGTRPRAVWACLAWLGTLFLAPSALPAAPLSRPIVAGFERFSTGAKADPVRGGRLLLTELNCVSCHSAEKADLARKQAPVLDHVASRVRLSYLRKYLADPHAAKPGTTMPNLLAGDENAKDKIEALVHFLADTGAIKHERSTPKAVAAGRDLYHKVGCFACHGTRNAAGDPDKVQPTSVPLGNLKDKYSIPGLAAFLQKPHESRPSGRMPRLLSTADEATNVAAYLLQGVKFPLAAGRGSANYSYYEGGWTKLPDFSKLKPTASGVVPGFDLSAARRGGDYALKFDAFLKIDRDATYNFTLSSDDGSRLLIDDKMVVNNDGVHPPTPKKGRTRLSKGVHKVTVLFFQGGGGAELDVTIEARGFGQHDLGSLVAASADTFDKRPKPASNDPDALQINPTLVEKGKGLFASLGCASCHTLRQNKKPIASKLAAPPLAKLDANRGCLADKPARGAPVYGLDSLQRKAIAAALKAPAPAASPAETIATTLTTFNCYACHVRDKVGPEEAAVKLFATLQPEMGDEGRVPPPLDGVGAKLQADYFKEILDKGAHDRPYMHTRMPGFGLANVGHLVPAFAGVDRLPAAPTVTFKEPIAKVKSTARHLVGSQAFGCIKCHTFGKYKAEGVQGINMLLLPKRLKRDWFHAYVSDPQRIRPGTRMPAAFINGKSMLPAVLDGTAAQQIEAIWLYLSDGTKAQVPLGMGGSFIPLEPTTSAILYRNFIAGAGTRAIGVGYPEKINIAFDANEMRLALLWQGAFIDAGRHWTGRGEGYQPPLGDNILTLHTGAPFAVLEKPDEAWPTQAPKTIGYRFLGYKLSSDDRPTFNYSIQKTGSVVKVEDFPNAVTAGKEMVLRRTITLTAEKAPTNLYFRAGVGNKIVELADGWYQIDGWKFKAGKNVKPLIRKSGGKTELLVPVRFADGKAQLVHDYSW